MKNRHTKLAMVLVTSLGLLACGKDEAKTKNTSEAKAKAAENAPNATAPTPAAEKPKEQVSAKGAHFALGMMTAYEQCRTELANDKTDGIADCATKFVEASKNAHANAPEAAHEHITAAATAADALASAKLDDIAAVRLAFGELSKPIVAMLTAAPDVAKDYHVFECPMAKGYKRWAQPDGDLKNPYMGQGMLACGSEVHDHHTANQDGAEGHAGHAH